MGFDANTATAFWTVVRVTSSPLTSRDFEAICRLHLIICEQFLRGERGITDEIPKTVVGLGAVDGTR
jgi:hypothetical protein